MVIRLLVLIAALLMGTASSTPAAERFIPLSLPGDAVAPIPLVAQDGRRFTLADLHGNAVAVSFIYTRCRDARMCPLVSAKFARAQAAIGSAPIRLVVVTLDPAYDTAPVLQRYGRAFAQNAHYWTLATGEPAAIDEFAGRLGIASAETVPGVVIHTDGAIIIGPDGRIARAVYGNDWTATDLIAWARATLPGRSDAFAGVRAWLSEAVERCGGGGVAIGRPAMFALLGFALLVIGAAFRIAFRGEKPGRQPRSGLRS